MFPHGPVDSGEDVFDLALPFFMFSAAGADATKVESQRCHIRVFQSAGRAKDNFVVQRAAAEGMRMTDYGDAGGILEIAIERFEPPRATEKIDMAKRLAVHEILTRMRSPSIFTSCVATRNSGLPGLSPVSI